MSALYALPITGEDELAIFHQCTGRTRAPGILAQEAWLVCGRRSGKSFVLALIAVWCACFVDYRRYLAPGERATIPIIARDRDQARSIFRYITAMLEIPMLAKRVERRTRSSFDLVNSVTIEVHTASFKSPRGLACPVVLLDEIAYFPSDADASDPDSAVVAALRPSMAQFPNALLIAASSPYARKGVLFEAHRDHYGRDNDPVLVWKAPTKLMNPSIPQSVIDAAYERDSADAAAEYGAEFRSDLEAFINRDAVMACVERNCFERAPRPGIKYVGFVDISGSGADSFTMAVSHKDGDMLFLDCVREVKPPFSPESVVAEFSTVFKSYGIRKITGDKYAGAWPVEQFRKYGITYEQSAAPKSDLYINTLPLINSRVVSLLDLPRMINQLVALERRTSRGGKDQISEPAGQHDDIINSAAGSLVASGVRRQTPYWGTLGSASVPGVQLDFKTGRPMQPSRIVGSGIVLRDVDEAGNVLRTRRVR